MAILYKSNIDLGGLQLLNAAIHPTDTQPSSGTEGQIYFNTTANNKKLYVYDGTEWLDVTGDVRSISAGTGISVADGSGGDATVSLSHLGLETLTAISGESAIDSIFFYDVSSSTSAYLTCSTATGIAIDGTSLKLASIPNASLTNSSITVTGGAGLTATAGATSLGGTTTIDVGAGTGIAVETNAVALKNHASLSDDTLLMWDDTNGQLIDSPLSDDGTNVTVGSSRNLVISGNLTVQGSTTTVDSNTVNIGDNIIVLNADETAAASQDAGIEIERGTDTNKKLFWDETNDIWRTEGGLWVGSFGTQTVTSQSYVVFQDTGVTQEMKRGSVADIGAALGVGSHSILLDAVNRDNVSKSSNTYTVTHGLGSKLVNVQVVDATTYETVFVEVARTTTNAIEVRFADTVDNGDYICMTSLVGALDISNIGN